MEARALAGGIGYPVVMKIVSPDILHKTDAGGVVVGVADGDAAAAAYEDIVAGARAYRGDARIDGVQIQQTGHRRRAGGASSVRSQTPASASWWPSAWAACWWKCSRTSRSGWRPPARMTPGSMLDGIQAAEVLDGVRGSEAVDRDALVDIIVNVSDLIGDFPEIAEIDLNPVLAGVSGATAVDALIAVDFSPQKDFSGRARKRSLPPWTAS